MYHEWKPTTGSCSRDVFTYSNEELGDLFSRLTGRHVQNSDTWRVRLAPSIITRGEAELFGLSDPRFCRRVLITANGRTVALINLRRMRRFLDQSEYSNYIASLHKASSIADSLLRIPDNYSTPEWLMVGLSGSVLTDYGEDEDEHRIYGYDLVVPFLKHLRIVGGGMCAQACCFMATMFAYEWVRSVVSIPDITFLARKGSKDGMTLNLRGLNLGEIENFLSHPTIGLSTSIQIAGWRGSGIPSECDWRLLKTAIEAYIGSGFSILAPVEATRMFGRKKKGYEVQPPNVYYDNHVFDRPRGRSKNVVELRHLIILFGFHRKTNTVLFQDPGAMPFMTMSLPSLLLNGFYRHGEKAEEQKLIDPGTILPVTPGAVKLPLLDTRKWDDEDMLFTRRRGLLFISTTLDFYKHFNHFYGPLLGEERRCWQLARLDQLTNVEMILPWEQLDPIHLHAIAQAANQAMKQGWPPSHWVWLQISPDSICFWNAEVSHEQFNEETENTETFLVCLGVPRLDGQQIKVEWKVFSSNIVDDKNQNVSSSDDNLSKPEETKLPALALSIITSFSSGGIEQALADLPLMGGKDPLDVEAYAFFIMDCPKTIGELRTGSQSRLAKLPRLIRGLLGHLRLLAHQFPVRLDINRNPKMFWKRFKRESFIWPESNVCALLASQANNEKYIHEVAQRLSGLCCPVGNVFGMATFFPGLTSTKNKEREECQSALICLVKIIREFNQMGGQTIRILEIVGGGRIADCFPQKIGNEVFLEAEVLAEDESIRRMLDSLCPVAKIAKKEVSLALELEPGPLYAVSSFETLVKTGNLLREYPDLQDVLGFNVDIGHWVMAGVTPAKMMEPEAVEVFCRVIHGHVSGFGKGHFSDLCPRAENKALYQEWLRVIDSGYQSAKRNFHVSGRISLEMELACNVTSVRKAIELCRNWFIVGI